MSLLKDLSPAQQEAVTHEQGPLLVLAGPGSGKTRVLTYRIAYLIQERGVPPEAILAVTFTNKAAEEMRERLEGLVPSALDNLWVHTFHAAGLRLLREHGSSIGLDPHFVVFDEEMQKEAVGMALDRLGWGRLSTTYDVNDILRYLGVLKARGLAPAELPDLSVLKESKPSLSNLDFIGDRERETGFEQVGEVYQQILSRYNALDFDDLLVKTVHLLDEDSELLARLRQTFRYVLVDEYHDVNPAQYAFLQRIAPPGSNITIVADPNQSIYGWRGAEPKLINAFHKEYKPRIVPLEDNYRSTPQILTAALALINKDPAWRQQHLKSVRPAGTLPEHHIFTHLTDEQHWLESQIRRLLAEGTPAGEIAVLYRNHWVGDAAEQTLRRASIPVQRVQPDSFFQHPGVAETLRYLQLLQSFIDPHLRIALNFPRVIADELTMIQLQSLAQRDGISLAELALMIDHYPEVSPLTRAAVRRFVQAFETTLRPAASGEIASLVDTLFQVLSNWRSPYPDEEMETLTGFAEYLSLPAEAQQLRAALDAGRPVVILTPPDIDALCAATILEQTLTHYLIADVGLRIEASEIQNPQSEIQDSNLPPFVIALGAGEAPADLRLLPRQTGTIRYSLSTLAWRLAQRLLVSYETLDDDHFVIYDLETTGTSLKNDEIIEIGAVTVDRRAEVGEPFHRLIRPRLGRIPRAATQVHGIVWEDVRDQSPIEAVLPSFLRYLGDAILVGHNVKEFDHRLLSRELETHLHRGLHNRTLDTLEMARRLLPRQNHTLESLVRHFRLGEQTRHRALADVRQERDLLFALMEKNRWQKELGALTELLPLVAIGMIAAGVPLTDENRTLYQAAARVSRRETSRSDLNPLLARLPDEQSWAAQDHLATLQKAATAETLADIKWAELRHTWEEQVHTFATLSREQTLAAFLDYAALVTSEEEQAAPDRVTLMSLHSAKGKEFSVVFILGCEETLLPYWRRQKEESAIQEERRVLYVGMTRARDRLYLVSTLKRGQEQRNQVAPSPFVLELPRNVLIRHNHPASGSS